MTSTAGGTNTVFATLVAVVFAAAAHVDDQKHASKMLGAVISSERATAYLPAARPSAPLVAHDAILRLRLYAKAFLQPGSMRAPQSKSHKYRIFAHDDLEHFGTVPTCLLINKNASGVWQASQAGRGARQGGNVMGIKSHTCQKPLRSVSQAGKLEQSTGCLVAMGCMGLGPRCAA